MDADELDPGLNGHVRERVGQQEPRALSADKKLARPETGWPTASVWPAS
jgi:hypothetical protein